MTETILENAMLDLPHGVRKDTLCLKDGQIVYISTGTDRIAAAVDCEGDLVMPGLIELHTYNPKRHIRVSRVRGAGEARGVWVQGRRVA